MATVVAAMIRMLRVTVWEMSAHGWRWGLYRPLESAQRDDPEASGALSVDGA